MDFRHIEAFVHVYRLRNFSRAGNAIYLTQSTISSHIKYLEKYLGVDLFDRSNHDVIPTEAGDNFYQYAVNLLETKNCAVCSLNHYKKRIEGRLEIVASTIPSQYLLPRILKGFRDKYPDIQFTLLQSDTREVIKEIRDKKFQLGLVGTRMEEDKLHYQVLTSDKLVMISVKENTNKCTDTIRIEDLRDKNFILRESGSGTRQEFEKALLKKGINPATLKVIAEMNSNEAIKIAVSEGLGVSVVSSTSIRDYLDLGLIQAHTIAGLELERSFYLVTHKNRPLSPCSAAFQEYILEYYKNK